MVTVPKLTQATGATLAAETLKLGSAKVNRRRTCGAMRVAPGNRLGRGAAVACRMTFSRRSIRASIALI